MPNGWATVALGTLITKRDDFTQVVPDAQYKVVGVQRSGWGLVDREPIRGDGMKFSKLMELEEDNLVYRTITAFEAPSTVVGPAFAGAYVTPQTFPVFRIEASRLLPAYMKLLTTSPRFHNDMADRCTGTVLRRKTISVGAFCSIPIALPSLAEQHRIIDLIGALDDAIEIADELTTAVMSAQTATLASLYWSLDSEITTASSLMTYMIGGSWGENPFVAECPTIALGPSAFAGWAADVDPAKGSERSLSAKKLAARALAKDDIIIERSGGSPTQPVGRVIRAGSNFPNTVHSDFMRLVRVDSEKAEPSFVFWALRMRYSLGDTVVFQKQTTNIRNLNITDYLDSPFRLPRDRRDQMAFSDLGEALSFAVEETRNYGTSLRTLRTNVLAACLGGEHEIPTSYDEVMGVIA